MELPASCAESPKDPFKDAALMHRQYAGVGFFGDASVDNGSNH